MSRMTVFALGVFSLISSAPAFGASAADMSAVSPLIDDAGFAAAMRAREAEDFAGARALLDGVLLRHPGEAEAWSQHGYAARKIGDLDASGVSYARALSLDPNHLGALEYQGELFIMLGDRDAAIANLERLRRLCGECEEFIDLQEEIEAAAQ